MMSLSPSGSLKCLTSGIKTQFGLRVPDGEVSSSPGSFFLSHQNWSLATVICISLLPCAAGEEDIEYRPVSTCMDKLYYFSKLLLFCKG